MVGWLLLACVKLCRAPYILKAPRLQIDTKEEVLSLDTSSQNIPTDSHKLLGKREAQAPSRHLARVQPPQQLHTGEVPGEHDGATAASVLQDFASLSDVYAGGAVPLPRAPSSERYVLAFGLIVLCRERAMPLVGLTCIMSTISDAVCSMKVLP